MGKVVVFDLDGTIALCDHRLHFISGAKRDWAAFYQACVDDKPNWPVIYTLRAMAQVGYKILILSGRSDEVREQTLTWLNAYGIPVDGLYMRQDKDYTPDDQLKEKMMSDAQAEIGFKPENVLCIYDDRQKVVDMWRKNGYTCFQVAAGDF